METERQLLLESLNNDSDDSVKKLDGLRRFLVNICYAGVLGNLSVSSIASFVASVYIENTGRDTPVDAEPALGYVGPTNVKNPLAIPSIITDVLWLLDQSTDPKVQSGMETERGRVVDLAKKLMVSFFGGFDWERGVDEFGFRQEISYLKYYSQLIGLVHDAKKMEKNEVRTRTTMLYAQTKYNLLREESEGYAKLITELFGRLPKLHDAHLPSATGGKSTPAEAKRLRAQAVNEHAQSVMRNITSLIGYFRIDPNRVLDIILDLFTANIADHWDFFLRLLEISPWAPRQDQRGQKASSKCGQVLGFKFDWYNKKSTGRNVPENLVYVAAVLIKHGLVQLGDLYPHLTPADEDIPTVYKDYLDGLRKAEKTAGRFQVQELVGTLGDDAKTSTAVTSQVKEDKVEAKKTTKVNQKAELVAALIAIGHVKTASTMIERQPRLVDLQPEISENLCRWLRELTGPWDTGISNRSLMPCGRVLGDRNRHCFFYEDWKSEMPVIRNAFEFVQRLRMYLAYLGPYLYRDPILVGQLIRMGALHVTVADQRLKGQTTTQSVLTPQSLDAMDSVPYEKITGWLNIVVNYLLPAISQSGPNPANSQGLWQILKVFPYEKRYALYGEWKNRLYSDTPEMRVAKAGCERDCRYMISRLSKDSGKQSGRQIGKVVHSNPVVAFAYIIKQLESYDNMIPHVVDASRYLTELEFDILPYCLIGALAEPKKRTEGNGMSIAPWLKSLATFTGQVFKKHPMELTALLRYLVSQLTVGNVHDLIVLHELVGSMSGIKPMEEATAAQLEALGGGETLKREAFIWENIRTMRRSGLRLMRALVDTGYSSQLAILISQRKQEIIYQGMNTEDDNMDVKILAWLNDYCQRTLLQYAEFLTCAAPPDVYAMCMSGVGELIMSYGLDPKAAFFLGRVNLACEVKIKPLNEDPVLIPTPNISTMAPLEECESAEDESTTEAQGEQKQQQPMSSSGNVWIPGLQPTIQSVAPLLPSTVWSGISSPFYVTFWQLSLYDIFVPKTRYHAEISTQKKHIRTFETEIAQLEREQDHASVEEARKKRKDIDRANVAIKTLEAEWRIHEDHHKGVMKWLKRENSAWFETSANRSDIINTMIQYCLQPRCVQSPADAMFCAKFIIIMHSLGTPNIPIATLYDRICSRDIIHVCIFAATEDEAKNYGTFLALIFQTLNSWHKNAALFQKEAIGSPPLPGFRKKWPTGVMSGQLDLTHADFIEYEEFLQALRKWHLKLCKAVLACLSSGEFMQIRNAILVLDRVNDYFPATKQMGQAIKPAVMELEKKETRGDL
ncbi:transcription factor/nuclear export subunit protein 2-domain-containing protein [Phlyctochytrium arcticum]|nr:transcription factor/nuclear export subunit protein 2-domain-containing protein [Phlyctochytrium arcticum]